jgi:hypothetical protein
LSAETLEKSLGNAKQALVPGSWWLGAGTSQEVAEEDEGRAETKNLEALFKRDTKKTQNEILEVAKH